MLEVLRTWASSKKKFPLCFNNSCDTFKYMNKFKIFCSTFSVTSFDVPTDMQLEIIDLMCDSIFKEKFDCWFRNIQVSFSWLSQTERPSCQDFVHTYPCQQVFSVMNINKNRLHPRLTSRNLNDFLKLAASQEISPNIDALVKAKRFQVSGSY